MPFTEAEWKVMKIVWELGSCQAKDIYTAAQARYGWAQGTTKSLIFRLVSKGYLHTRQTGNKYIYTPKAKMKEEVFSQTGEILEGIREQVAGDLACHLLETGELSERNIEELRSILKRYKKPTENKS
ncbi:MAG: BlaI/MecI/CopY family transcriptional regulator [bacterium]|nr:BlaI/MecI/CopY family transcriptional regulator [bacterium]